MPQNQVHHRGRFLGNLVHLPGLNPGLVQGRGRAPGGIDGIAQLREASSYLNGLSLVRVLHGDNHVLMPGQIHPRP